MVKNINIVIYKYEWEKVQWGFIQNESVQLNIIQYRHMYKQYSVYTLHHFWSQIFYLIQLHLHHPKNLQHN